MTQLTASTIIGTSGKNAFAIITFEITQMSVHNPITVMLSIFSSLLRFTSLGPSSDEPKVTLSITSVFLNASSSPLICQPSVSLIQCFTGKFLPS